MCFGLKSIDHCGLSWITCLMAETNKQTWNMGWNSSLFSAYIHVTSGVPAAQPPQPTKTPSSDDNSSWSIPLVIGLCVAGGLVLIIALVVACCAMRRLLKSKQGKMHVRDHEKGRMSNGRAVNGHKSVIARSPESVINGKNSTPRYIGMYAKWEGVNKLFSVVCYWSNV